MSVLSVENLIVCFLDHIESTTLHLLPNFTQNFSVDSLFQKLIAHFYDGTWKHTRHISATTPTQVALMSSGRDWRKLKHAQTCLYYDQVV
jgi:uncharacterized protein YktB (UPF0637 family)